MNVLISVIPGLLMFFVSRIFSALFSGIVSKCYGFKKKKAKYSSVINCFNCLFPSVRTVDFDDKIL